MIAGGNDLFPVNGLPGIICKSAKVIDATRNVVRTTFEIPYNIVFIIKIV